MAPIIEHEVVVWFALAVEAAAAAESIAVVAWLAAAEATPWTNSGPG